MSLRSALHFSFDSQTIKSVGQYALPWAQILERRKSADFLGATLKPSKPRSSLALSLEIE